MVESIRLQPSWLRLARNACRSRPRAAALWLAIVLLLALPDFAQAQLEPLEQQPLSDGGSIPIDNFGMNTHLWAAFDGGEGPWNDGSYGTFGVFSPQNNLISNFGNEILTYVDGRVGIQNDGGVIANASYGARLYRHSMDRVFGVAARYTADNTRRNFFQQLTVSAETFGDWIDGNINGYLPFGDKGHQYGTTGFVGMPIFGGNTLLLPQFNLEEQAMHGFDAEIGTRIPGIPEDLNARIWGGYYWFDSDDIAQINGVRARVEAQVLPQITLHITATHDNRFDTHVMAGVIWEFTKSLLPSSPDYGLDNREALGRLSRFNHQVMVAETARYSPVPAIDATTGQPFNIIHVNSNAAPGGDGSIEQPLQALGAASAQAGSGDIVFLHGGSVFDGASFTMQDNQRLWGEGGDYTVRTRQMGATPLPRATTSNVPPIIRNSIGAGVRLANNVEVLGIRVENAAGSSFLGDGISGTVRMAANSVDGSFRGIEIRNSTGTFDIENASIANTTDDSIVLEENTSAATINFTGTTSVDNAGGIGISIQGGEATINFADVSLTNRNSTAIGLGRAGGTVTFANPFTIDNPNGSLTEAIGVANGTGTVNFPAVTITDTNRAAPGLPQVILGNNSNTTIFDSLDITTTNGGGISALNVGTVTVNGGRVPADGGQGVVFNGVDTLTATFESVSTVNATNGITVINSDGSIIVTGDGATPGSGGTINVSGIGIRLLNSQSTQFNYMDITAGTNGLDAFNSDDVVLNSSNITGTSAGFIGVDINNDETFKTGSPVVLASNTITSSGDNAIGIQMTNNKSPQGSLRIDDHVINMTGTNTTGISISVIDDNPASGPGDIVLLSLQDNTVTSTAGQEFIQSQMSATIFGQILVNGVLEP